MQLICRPSYNKLKTKVNAGVNHILEGSHKGWALTINKTF